MYMYVVYAVLVYSYNKNVMFVSFLLSTGDFVFLLAIHLHYTSLCMYLGNTFSVTLLHVHDVQCV